MPDLPPGRPANEQQRLATVIQRMFQVTVPNTLWQQGAAGCHLEIGPGDDCAALRVAGEVVLVVGSDYVRGPKFTMYELGLLQEGDLGYYLIAANVSDVAAMGARPLIVLTVVRYPHDLSDSAFEALMAGIAEACEHFGVLNVGGDIGSAERIILSGTAIGAAQPGRVLTRRGARPGDIVCCTGPTGLAGAALMYFDLRQTRGWTLPSAIEEELLAAWRRPQARVQEGSLLGELGTVTACQDTSDGLLATLEQVAAASSVGLVIKEDDVPIAAGVAAVAGLADLDPLSLALSVSVDFQLLFTVPAASLSACQREFSDRGLTISSIGVVTDGAGEVRIEHRDGSVREPASFRWHHESGRFAASMYESLDGPPRLDARP